MSGERFHINDPNTEGYYDPYNWGEKSVNEEMVLFVVADMVSKGNDELAIEIHEGVLDGDLWAIEAIRKYYGMMGH